MYINPKTSSGVSLHTRIYNTISADYISVIIFTASMITGGGITTSVMLLAKGHVLAGTITALISGVAGFLYMFLLNKGNVVNMSYTALARDFENAQKWTKVVKSRKAEVEALAPRVSKALKEYYLLQPLVEASSKLYPGYVNDIALRYPEQCDMLHEPVGGLLVVGGPKGQCDLAHVPDEKAQQSFKKLNAHWDKNKQELDSLRDELRELVDKMQHDYYSVKLTRVDELT